MEKQDIRKLSTEAQQQIRYAIVRLRESGESYAKVTEILGVSSSLIYKCWRKYKKYGLEDLKIKKQGVKLGTGSKLSFEQSKILRQILIDKTPNQLGLGFELWTRHAIQNLIVKMWKIEVSLVTVGRYMKKLGFTPQKPIKRAYEQNPKAVKKWLNETYPEIALRAISEKAEIHWLDETKINSYSNYIRGYAPKGRTPLIKMKSKRMNSHIISSVSKLGKMRFMIYKDSLDTKILIKFVRRLARIVDKRIFLIMDNLAVHHSKKFRNWLDMHKDKIKVFYLPSYSPELNPDERLNRDLKTHFHSGSLVRNTKEFKNKIISFLLRVQKQPLRIKNYFNSDYVRYAA